MSLLNDIQTLLQNAMWEDLCNKSPLVGLEVGEDGVFVDMGCCDYPILTGSLSKEPYFWVSVDLRESQETFRWRSELGGGEVEISQHLWGGHGE